jgi:hypothetical protein
MIETAQKQEEKRPSFEIFKSTICHMVKDMGDIDFLIHILESGEIFRLRDKEWHAECLYLLAMVDYLGRLNGFSPCDDFSELRRTRLTKPIYPSGVTILCTIQGNDNWRVKSWDEAIPEFKRFNIVENDIRNVN